MTQIVTAIFENERIATEASNFLQLLSMDAYDAPIIAKDRLKDSNGVSIQLRVHTDQIIAAYEIVRSFSGELITPYFEEVMHAMYNIPEESFETDAADDLESAKQKHEVGTLGYPFDLLNDNAYIDPNIGLGDHDLLIPFMEPEEQEQ